MGRKLQYTFDETFFETIDTELKAYWLGFIYADGCVINRSDKNLGSNVFQVKLGTKDQKFLEKLKTDMQASHPIKVYTNNHGYGKGRDYCIFTIRSDELYRQLVKLGVVQNKSLILSFPDNDTVPKKLVNHFIRGYFDGDGSIYKYKCKGFVYPRLSINGTKEFLEKLLQYAPNGLGSGIYKEARKPNSNTYFLTVSGRKRCRSFYDYLYEKAERLLPRKKEVFDTLLGLVTQESLDHTSDRSEFQALHPLE